jgi:hypothetical protein
MLASIFYEKLCKKVSNPRFGMKYDKTNDISKQF